MAPGLLTDSSSARVGSHQSSILYRSKTHPNRQTKDDPHKENSFAELDDSRQRQDLPNGSAPTKVDTCTSKQERSIHMEHKKYRTRRPKECANLMEDSMLLNGAQHESPEASRYAVADTEDD
jgi:hypothetical protein